MIRILINKCKDILRLGRRMVCVEELPEQETGSTVEAEANLEWKEALQGLDEKYRLIVVLFYAEGLRTAEIGNYCSFPTVRCAQGSPEGGSSWRDIMRRQRKEAEEMRPMNEIEIELPQIVLDRADAAYAQIRQQAAQESPAGRRVRSFPRAAGILLAVVILSATAVSAAAVGIVGYRRYMAERMTDIGTEELGHLEMVAEQGNVTAEFSRELTARERSIYEQLTREYEADGKYPAGQIRELAEDENYSGTGVAVRSTPGEEYGCLIYLPDTVLTEEEWLEIIEYLHKLDYSLRENYGSRSIPRFPI